VLPLEQAASAIVGINAQQPIPAESKRKILWDNAARFFGLER